MWPCLFCGGRFMNMIFNQITGLSKIIRPADHLQTELSWLANLSLKIRNAMRRSPH